MTDTEISEEQKDKTNYVQLEFIDNAYYKARQTWTFV